MIRCTRCHRAMKAPTPSGLGPKCAEVLRIETAQKRTRRQEVQRKRRVRMHDDLTPDMFEVAR